MASWRILREMKAGYTCECGCGGLLPRLKYYGKLRILYGEYPRFLVGHQNRMDEIKVMITGRPDVTTAWLLANKGKILCKCGCGKAIKLQKEYHAKGVPDYVLGHNPNSRNAVRTQKRIPPQEQCKRVFSFSQRIKILAEHGFCCASCGWGGTEAAHQLEFDHILPVAKGGKTHVRNGQPLCRPCHKAKTKGDCITRRTHNKMEQGYGKS